jgi:uncharacterized protein
VGPLLRTAAAVGGLGLGCVAYGTLVERRWYRLRHLRLEGVLREPDSTLRILQVADLHLSPGQEHRVEFVASLAELDHDLVVAAGDLLGEVGMEQRTADALAPLTAGGQPGVVVLGSNDFYAPVLKNPFGYFLDPGRRVVGERLDTGRFVDLLGDRGYTTLRDEATTVATRRGTVAIGGLDDPHLPWTRLPSVDAVRPPVDDAILDLGLVHAPYLAALDLLADAGHGLLLAGHTHGGQVRLPAIGALTANCDLPLDQARGLSRHRDRWLHVTPGVGHGRYAPFRFACRPEATLLELTG